MIFVQISALIRTYFFNDDPNYFYLFIVLNLISTFYSYSWDIYMDWGLFRSNERGKRCLREKLLYPVWFYYFAMGSNLLMRFIWVLPLFNEAYPQWMIDSQLVVFFMSVVEGLRKTQWALIRIENENVNNFERYRNILQIPDLKDFDNEKSEDD